MARESLEAFLDRYMKSYPIPSLPPDHVLMRRINPGGGVEGGQLQKSHLLHVAEQRGDKRWWATQVLKWGVVRLDGRSRFNLTNDQNGGDLLAPPANVLAHLFRDDVARERVRSIVHDAFGLYFVVDPTNLGTLRIRLSAEPPMNDEQSLNIAAREFHGKAIHISDASDGVQAFVGIVSAVMSGEFHTILIDEPEAFLHPPLARKLGKHLASLAVERGGALLASTHSPDFLMGCIQATKDVRVVRLEYANGRSRGRVVDPVQLERFFKHPLMRSANVVSALFYDGVVVTESDNDRAFYHEIYHRLAEQDPSVPSLLFINTQNKQTLRDVVGPLRQFGVPAVAIPDIDVIKEGGGNWTSLLEAARVPQPLHRGSADQRASVKSCFDSSGKNMKTDGGVEILSGDERLAAEQLFDDLAQYGVFVVRCGEVECWLKSLNVPGKKTDWAVAMLDRLGSDPSSVEYVRPSDSDVWVFIRKAIEWVRNPGRKGT